MLGMLAFDGTDAGRTARGMVRRGELRGVSVFGDVDTFVLENEAGEPVDPRELENYVDEQNFVFRAIRWRLAEASLVMTGADPLARIIRRPADRVTMARVALAAKHRMWSRRAGIGAPPRWDHFRIWYGPGQKMFQLLFDGRICI
ncbi:MAG TPA: hypothetical protein VEJ37_05015 [Xanthobacteraceae bacterium]|nr:hypothetical protein [Xanthobacteraceae bacterium]